MLFTPSVLTLGRNTLISIALSPLVYVVQWEGRYCFHRCASGPRSFPSLSLWSQILSVGIPQPLVPGRFQGSGHMSFVLSGGGTRSPVLGPVPVPAKGGGGNPVQDRIGVLPALQACTEQDRSTPLPNGQYAFCGFPQEDFLFHCLRSFFVFALL